MNPLPDCQIRQKGLEILGPPLPSHGTERNAELHPLLLSPGKAGQFAPAGIGFGGIKLDAFPSTGNQLLAKLTLHHLAVAVQAGQGVDPPE